MTQNPDALFELFFHDLTPEMNPLGMKHRGNAMYHFWLERFMNAYYGVQEPYSLRGWGEAPQMWLIGYRRGYQQKEAN